MHTDDHDELTRAPDGQPMSEQPRWRQDFPIDVPQDNYISRREFTKFLVLTSAAFTAGQGWILLENVQREREAVPTERRIAALADIPIGGSLLFNYPNENDPCLLLRPDADTLVAYSQKCTHLSCAVMPDMEHNRIACPCHKGYFDLADGRPIGGPPQRPLPRIVLEVRANEVYAVGVELRTV